MTPNADKDPALLEQARELVKAIKPIPLYDELDKRTPVKPGYTLRYEDLRRDLAIEIAYETLVRTGQPAPAARQRDLDTLARALAAGRRAALAHRDMQRGADLYTVANENLLAVQRGLEALERLAGKAPPADPAESAESGQSAEPAAHVARPSTPAPVPKPAPAAPAGPAPEVNW